MGQSEPSASSPLTQNCEKCCAAA